MAKPKKDRHSKSRKPVQLRMHALIHQQLQLLVDRNLSTMTSEVMVAIRKHLEQNGLWPPPADQAEK